MSLIPLTEAFEIPAPADEVWPLLCDPALVAACIPGATMSAVAGDDLYQGNIRFKFGPTVAIFRGETRLTYDQGARHCTIDARGTDQRGASRALARFLLSASGTATTQVKMDGGFKVTGPLEMFANAGGVHVARALMVEFAANIAHIVEERQQEAVAAARSSPPAGGESSAAAGAAPAATQIAVRSIGGGRLIWRSLLGWLRGIFYG